MQFYPKGRLPMSDGADDLISLWKQAQAGQSLATTRGRIALTNTNRNVNCLLAHRYFLDYTGLGTRSRQQIGS